GGAAARARRVPRGDRERRRRARVPRGRPGAPGADARRLRRAVAARRRGARVRAAEGCVVPRGHGGARGAAARTDGARAVRVAAGVEGAEMLELSGDPDRAADDLVALGERLARSLSL